MSYETLYLENIIAEIRNGLNTTQYDVADDGMLAISRIETISDGTIDFKRVKYAKVTEAERKKYQLRQGDILFSHINSPDHIGKTALFQTDRDLIHGVNLLLLRCDQKRCYPEYLSYYLKTVEVRTRFRTHCKRAVNQASLNQGDILSLEVPLPPFDEQKRIAAILSKADRLRRLRRYARELSDSYLQSVFLEMFGDPVSNPRGWERATIGDVVASSQYGTSDKSNSEKRGYPVLGMGNITYSGEVDLTSLAYVELSQVEFKTLRLEPGDIIFNRTNSTELVGKTAHWKYNIDAVLASYLVKLKLQKNTLPDYFAALLNSRHYKQLFQERCKKAVGQSNISPTLLKEFPVLIPPLPLQQKFAQIVQKYERLRAQQRESERQGEHLFQSLLHRAFRGELNQT